MQRQKAAELVKTTFAALIVIVVISTVAMMFRGWANDRRTLTSQQEFCLDHGYLEVRQAAGVENTRFWCINKTTAVSGQALGWRGQHE